MTRTTAVARASKVLRRGFLASLLAAVALAAWGCAQPEARAPAGPQWYKGNTHVHSRWSDGRDYPEVVADWYKSHGYHFLCVSDHNTLQVGEKWVPVVKPEEIEHLATYRQACGDDWVLQADRPNPKDGQVKPMVRLKTLKQYRARYEEPGRFLLIHSEEITGRFDKVQVHVNAVNAAAVIPPQKGASVHDTLAADVRAVHRQQTRERPMLATLNHPNWGGVVPIEEFLPIPALRFFEVMNTHPTDVYNRGDAKTLSTDRLWDVALAQRLGDLGLAPLLGVAADDSHKVKDSGSGWVMVRAAALTPRALIEAMKAGDFYSTTGVLLKDVRREGPDIVVEVDPQEGVTYRTQFIGTLHRYDRRREDARDAKGNLLPPTQRYSPEIGKVLKEVQGTRAVYTPTGDELYVRAKVISSRLIPNPDPKKKPDDPGEPAVAWTQPFVIRAPGR